MSRRITIDCALTENTPTPLTDEQRHYLETVLRLTDGQVIDLIDETGAVWTARLAFGLHATVTPLKAHPPASEPELILVAALIKQARWEWLIEKATELGVTAIQPWEAGRCVVQIRGPKRDAKQTRWQKICDSATRQSEQAWRVEVRTPLPLDAILASTAAHTNVWLDEQTRTGAWTSLDIKGPTALFVGPEGGITDQERALLTTHTTPVGLGDGILRAETAGITALAAVRLRRSSLW